jgi:hypothetical protein
LEFDRKNDCSVLKLSIAEFLRKNDEILHNLREKCCGAPASQADERCYNRKLVRRWLVGGAIFLARRIPLFTECWEKKSGGERFSQVLID